MSLLTASVAFFATLAGAVLADLVNEEIRGQLDRIPVVLLSIARRRLPEAMRGPLHDEEWYPELQEILNGENARPVSRLVIGVRYSLGLIRRAHLVASIRNRKVTVQTDHDRWLTVVELLRSAADLCVVLTGVMISGGAGALLGLLLPQLLHIGHQRGPLLGTVLGLALTIAFGTGLGVAITLVLSSGLRRITRRLLVTRIDRSADAAPERQGKTRLLRSVVDFAAGAGRDNAWGLRVAAFLGAYTGAGLAILLGTAFSIVWQPLLIGAIATGALVFLRVSLVTVPGWWLRRLRERLETDGS
ncbi:hypothetical protein [Nonomuraea sp. NPDC048916]|uniref:hypothetical protein n=1 Tax=Nonomuraea sp. NPDC048916 TaxID=3154232 RepID=UPI0033F73FEE